MNCIPKPSFPRPEKRRERWMNLNGSWQFELFAAGNENAEERFAQARTAYTRTIQVPFSWVCPLSGVEENVAGIGWYRRAVEYAGTGRLFLCFGAVDYLADVYVNGQLAGSHFLHTDKVAHSEEFKQLAVQFIGTAGKEVGHSQFPELGCNEQVALKLLTHRYNHVGIFLQQFQLAQHADVRCITHQGIGDPVFQFSDDGFTFIEDGDLKSLLGQMQGKRAAKLANTDNDDFHSDELVQG